MPELGARIVLIALGTTFAWAALAKAVAWARWRSTVASYGFSGRFGAAATVAVPALELMVPALLILGATREAAVLALGLLVGFSAAIVRARRSTGPRLACGCFGRAKDRDYRVLLARNGALGAGTLVALTTHIDLVSGDALVAPSSGDIVPIALTVVGTAAIAALFAVAARNL